MADSPQQRIPALLSATPDPERPSAYHWRDFKGNGHRAIAARTTVSRVLPPGDRGKQNMDVLRASQGRVSADRLRGMPRIRANARRAAPGRTAQRP
ncbi:hypothetical protein [Luteimonas saliphila]|uniref:hypothetical protein n=1 Tax=Luteimonas saliphila TaxID=2804919 RepID=UPI00192DAF89|nr:hypothetical protein [Luteimonas saliphila]